MNEEYSIEPCCECLEPIEHPYSFRDLFSSFISGTPIKRKGWRGYWKYDTELKNIKIYTKEGKVLLFTDTNDILFSLSHISEYDWEIATNKKCDIEVK